MPTTALSREPRKRASAKQANSFFRFPVFVLSWLVVGSVAFVGVDAQTPASTPAGNSQNGKALYEKFSCYACHGYDGHGGAGARLVPTRMNAPGFTAYIRNPRQMPPYTEKVLSDGQAADLFAYIKAMPESPSADKLPLLTRIMSER
jgi:mono/diheme cytochrome c family protein